jgi:hypothetical protein
LVLGGHTALRPGATLRAASKLAGLPGDVAVDQDVSPHLVVIPHVAGRELEEPVHLPGVRIPGNRAVGVEVVAGAVGRVDHRHRIAGAPNGLVGAGVIGACHNGEEML